MPVATGLQASLLAVVPSSRSMHSHEDSWMAVREENIELKKRLNEQTEVAKKLSVRLQHMAEDAHRQNQRQLSSTGHKPPPLKRSLSLEALVDDLRLQVRDLSKSNSTFKTKLQYYKSMNTAISKRKGVWDHVGSRVDIGPKRAIIVGQRNSPTPGNRPRSEQQSHSEYIPPSTEETEQLHEVIAMMREQLMEKDYIIEQQQMDMATELATIEQHVSHPFSTESPKRIESSTNTEEALPSISSQRSNATDYEIKLLENKLADLEATLTITNTQLTSSLLKNGQCELQMANAQNIQDQLSKTINQLTESVTLERAQKEVLQSTLQKLNAEAGHVQELLQLIEQLRSENGLLTIENKRLVDLTVEQILDLNGPCVKHEEIIQQAESVIQQLQNEAKIASQEHTAHLTRIKEFLDENEKLQLRLKESDKQYHALEAKHDQYHDKMQVFAESNGMSIIDVQEALAIIRWRKHKNIPLDVIMATDDLLKESSSMVTLRADYLSTMQDLDRTKKILDAQESINADYKRDLQQLLSKWDQVRVEYETRVNELSRLLDLRQTRILHLERQLKTSLYGKKSGITGTESEDDDEDDSPALLVSVKCLNIKRQISLNTVYFITSDFYTFDTVVSPLAMGPNPQFNFTLRFPLLLDYATLSYLHRHFLNVDVWVLRGSITEVIGRCCIPLMGLLDLGTGLDKTQCTADVYSDIGDLPIGKLEYTLRLTCVLDEAVRDYRDRYSAGASPSGIIDSVKHSVNQASAVMEPRFGHMQQGELCLRVHRCYRVVTSMTLPPSVYITCQLYTRQFVTESVNGRDPQFEHEFRFNVSFIPDFVRYLKTNKMTVLVFDDNHTSDIDAFIGSARVPLSDLISGDIIRQVFPITNGDEERGQLILSIVWETSFAAQLPHAISLEHADKCTSKETATDNTQMIVTVPELIDGAILQPLDIEPSHSSQPTATIHSQLLIQPQASHTNTLQPVNESLFSPNLLSADHFTIVIERLQLEENFSSEQLAEIADINNVFVGFDLLSYPSDDLETTSQKIWESDISNIISEGPVTRHLRQQINFGFIAGFPIDAKHNDQDRQNLLDFLSASDSVTVFSIVHDPGDDRECVDVAEGKLWWRECFTSEQFEVAINVYFKSSKTLFGRLFVAIKGWKWITDEIKRQPRIG